MAGKRQAGSTPLINEIGAATTWIGRGKPMRSQAVATTSSTSPSRFGYRSSTTGVTLAHRAAVKRSAVHAVGFRPYGLASAGPIVEATSRTRAFEAGNPAVDAAVGEVGARMRPT